MQDKPATYDVNMLQKMYVQMIIFVALAALVALLLYCLE